MNAFEDKQSRLTANTTNAESASLLDVNEKLYTLAPQLRERRPEDVAAALKLVEQYGGLVRIEQVDSNPAFQRLKEQLPKAELEKITLKVDRRSSEILKLEILHKKHYHIQDIAEEALDNFSLDSFLNESEITFVKLKVGDLMDEDDCQYPELLNRIFEVGLKECPKQTALWYLLQHGVPPDQEKYDFIMKRIRTSSGDVCFSIGKYRSMNGTDLCVYWPEAGSRFKKEETIICMLPVDKE